MAALLHDVGKIGVPDAILKKPGKLDDAEFAEMKRHTQIGADLFAGIRTDFDEGAAEGAVADMQGCRGAEGQRCSAGVQYH